MAYKSTLTHVQESANGLHIVEAKDITRLIKELKEALEDYHAGTFTLRPLAQTHKRDEELIRQAEEFLKKS